MLNEIDISKVPLTPKGVNHDFKAVKEFDYVRIDKQVAWKTMSLIGPDSDISECEDTALDGSIISTEKNVADLHQSPMIEFRKKRIPSIEGEVKFNPFNSEVIDTSIGWYKNYEKSKRKTIADLRRLSAVKPSCKTRQSLQSVITNDLKENLSPKNDNADINRKHLDLLRVSVSESRPLLSTERDRLSAAIVDWKHILQNEQDITPEAQGHIHSTVGRTQILLDKRFNSTMDVLDKAENYVKNDGIIVNDGEKEYKPDDIYGFVDLLINEIKNIDDEFTRLLKIRNDKWCEVEEPEEVVEALVVAKKRAIIGNATQNKKPVKSRIDIKSLRKLFAKGQTVETGLAESHVTEEEDLLQKHMNTTPIKSNDVVDMSLMSEADSMNESGRSLRHSVRKTVRSNCMIKSTTGTPVHFDTPRPRRSGRQSRKLTEPTEHFVTPSAPDMSLSPIMGQKRGPDNNDQFLLPVSQPKKSRPSKL